MASLGDRDPKQWGSIYWRMMHTMVEAYPASDPTDALRFSTASFFESMLELLPCEECRQHYERWWTENPIEQALLGQRPLADWLARMKQSMPGAPNTRTIVARSNGNAKPRSVRELRLEQQREMYLRHQKIRSSSQPSSTPPAPQLRANARQIPRQLIAKTSAARSGVGVRGAAPKTGCKTCSGAK